MKSWTLALVTSLISAQLGCASVHATYVVGASLPAATLVGPREAHSASSCVRLLKRNHDIVAGGGIVLSYRHWDAGDLLAIDDEVFEELTIEVPHVAFPHTFTGGDVRLFYSRGGAAWLYKCSGYF